MTFCNARQGYDFMQDHIGLPLTQTVGDIREDSKDNVPDGMALLPLNC